MREEFDSDTENNPYWKEGTQSGSRKKRRSFRLTYPWLSPLCAVLATLALWTLESGKIFPAVSGPEWLDIKAAVIAVTLLIVVLLVLDMQQFFAQKKALREQLRQLEEEVELALHSKRKLQERSHQYSDQAEKLKRFISDRLIEQIEYDDKFLHFKSIAAEIRHNGVISYDIVRRALEKAIDARQNGTSTLPDIRGASLADTHRFGLPSNPDSEAQQALQAMKYLWDLLDLSTADNIALHIGNYLIECEELYFEKELSKKRDEEAPTLSRRIIFSPALAAIKALAPNLEAQEMEHLIQLAASTPLSEDAPGPVETEHFRVMLHSRYQLLGNENHLILVLENLLKNAQYFSSKVDSHQSSDRIAVCLTQEPNHICFEIYNRGPQIQSTDRDKIFQLGYTTRGGSAAAQGEGDTSVHHGKGLGLYFVNEIVRGYQGRIDVDNISNRDDTLTLRIATNDGKVHTEVVELLVENAKPMLQSRHQDVAVTSLEWEIKGRVESLEVTSSNELTTHQISSSEKQTSNVIYDPQNATMPQWKLELHDIGKKSRVVLTALDVQGVKFKLFLPTAESRLSGDEPDFDVS